MFLARVFHAGSGPAAFARRAVLASALVLGLAGVANAQASYTITADAGAHGAIAPSGAVVVPAGTDTSFTITPDAHYHVADVLVDGSSVGAVTSYAFPAVASDHTISASFAIDTDVITASAGAHGALSPSGAVSVDYGADQAFAITPDPGYVVLDVLVDGVTVGPDTAYTFTAVTAAHTIAASFTPALPPATISAGSPSGTLSSTTASLVVPVTVSRTYDNPARLFHVKIQLGGGLALAGGTAGITEGTWLNSSGATTDFHIVDNGGGSYSVDGTILGTPCNNTALTGTLFNVAVASGAADGTGTVTVSGTWLRDCDNNPLPSAAGSSASVAIDNTAPTVGVTAPNGGETWIAGSSHAITWTASDDVAVSAVDLAYSTDGGATYPNAIASGLSNSGTYTWTVPTTLGVNFRVRATAHDAAGNQASDASDADFTVGQWTLTASAGSHGAIVPAGVTGVNQGGGQSYTITPDTHYHVADVLVDGASVGAVTTYAFTSVTANHTIAASFAIDTYPIVAVAGPGGSIAPPDTSHVAWDDSLAYTITPNAHFHVDSVTVDGANVGAVSAYTFTHVAAAHGIAAAFATDAFTITASAGAHGSITPAGVTAVLYGDSLALGISASTGWHVDSVYVDGASVGAVSAYTFHAVAGNHTISATFAINAYTITASAGAHGSIAPSGVTNVNYGDSLVCTLTPVAHYHVDSVLVDGASVGRLTAYTFHAITASHTISASFALNPASPAISALAAATVKSGNDGDGTTKITLTWPAVAAGSTVQVYRAPYGNYPAYDNAPNAGAVPALPSYPPSAPWALTDVTASGQNDEVTTRDCWYFVAFVTDSFGTVSPVSNEAGGTLNYFLGDVTDGTTPGQGNNVVDIADVSLLGAHYGLTGSAVTAVGYLDVGPTSNRTVDGRPMTDSQLDFEDLVLFAINYMQVSSPQLANAPAAATVDELALDVPAGFTPQGTLTARLMLKGTGVVQGLSATLAWNPAVVKLASSAPGELTDEQGAVMMTAHPGVLDVAKLGSHGAGLVGTGDIANATFERIGPGDPDVHLASVDARNAANGHVALPFHSVSVPVIPAVTSFDRVAPNPFRETATLSFGLARGGDVDLAIYSVDGRRVRQLVRGTRDAGTYQVAWDGRDESGSAVNAGVYYARLVTPQGRFHRSLVYLK